MNKEHILTAWVYEQKRLKSKVNAPFNAKKLGEAMIAKRASDEITIASACDASGVAPATYFRAEAASGKIDTAVLVKLCNWLQVPIQTFFQ